MLDNALRFSNSREKREEVVEEVKKRINKLADQNTEYDVKWIGLASEIIASGIRIWIAVDPKSKVINTEVDKSESHRNPDYWPNNPKKHKQPGVAVNDILHRFEACLAKSDRTNN